jgi:TonB family protein
MSASIRARIMKSMNRRAISFAIRALAVLVIAASLGIDAIGPRRAMAQEAPGGIEKLAWALAAELEKAHVKKVAIFDLEDVNNKQLPFGAFLADRLVAELSKSSSVVAIAGRERLTKAAIGEELDPKAQSKLTSAAAVSLGADAYVLGTYGAIGEQIGITLNAERINGKRIRSSKSTFDTAVGKITLDDDVKSQLGTSIESLRPADGVYKADVGGVGTPECERCPEPQFAPADVIRASEGLVAMNVIISREGAVLQVDVTKSGGARFDEPAVAAVRTWKFKPARDSDGNPVTVRQLVQVSFRIF